VAPSPPFLALLRNRLAGAARPWSTEQTSLFWGV
jgi:hypothetical protein